MIIIHSRNGSTRRIKEMCNIVLAENDNLTEKEKDILSNTVSIDIFNELSNNEIYCRFHKNLNNYVDIYSFNFKVKKEIEIKNNIGINTDIYSTYSNKKLIHILKHKCMKAYGCAMAGLNEVNESGHRHTSRAVKNYGGHWYYEAIENIIKELNKRNIKINIPPFSSLEKIKEFFKGLNKV